MAYEGMIAEMVSVSGHNGDKIEAYLARPTGPGPFPGVVLIHHLPGWDEWYREATRRFAHHGYAAISHKLYQRVGEGDAADVAAKARAEGGVSDAQMIGDTEGTVQWLKMQPYFSGKVGVIGSCSGGRQAFLYPAKPTASTPASTSGAAGSCRRKTIGRRNSGSADRVRQKPVLPAARYLRQRRPLAQSARGRRARGRTQEARQGL